MRQKLSKSSLGVKTGEGGNDRQLQVALISPSSLRCGIAEYSRQLASAFVFLKTPCMVANPSSSIIPQIKEKLDLTRPIAVSFQYHPEFYGPSELIEMVGQCTAENIQIGVTFHHTDLLGESYLQQLDHLGATFFVHTRKSLSRLKRAGLDCSFSFQMGVPAVPDEPAKKARARLKISSSPVIGTCGFLRPHKGLAELLEAMPSLLVTAPDLKLIAMQPLYPLPESPEYLVRCIRLIDKLSLKDKVKIHVDFMDSTELVRSLHACDVLVLPHAASTEGASAAARTAIAARRPVVTSPSGIFDDLTHVVYQSRGTHASALAAAVGDVLGNPQLRERLTRSSSQYADDNTWGIAAVRMLEIFAATRIGLENHGTGTSNGRR